MATATVSIARALIVFCAVTAIAWIGFRVAAWFLVDSEWKTCRSRLDVQTLTQREVEDCLFWYTTSECRLGVYDTARMLCDDKRCVRYEVLGLEPIDVVYNSGGTAEMIYPTYE